MTEYMINIVGVDTDIVMTGWKKFQIKSSRPDFNSLKKMLGMIYSR